MQGVQREAGPAALVSALGFNPLGPHPSEGRALSWPRNPVQQPKIGSVALGVPPQAHGHEELFNLLSSPNPLGPPLLKGDAREFRRIEGHPQTPGSLPLHRHSTAL